MRNAETRLDQALNDVSVEVDEFLEECLWIEKLSAFLLEWGGEQVVESRTIAEAMQPQEIEV